MQNGETIDNNTNGTVNIGTTTLQLTGGTSIVSDQASVDLLNTNTTTLNFGGAATSLNLASGGSSARTINIGTGTGADTITIGNTTAAIALALNDDNWNITGAGAANFVSIGATTPGTGTFTTLAADPVGTDDITFTLGVNSTLILSGLQTGTASSGLCVDSSNNVVTCASGGPISGSGTSGQIAFFNTSSSLTSETTGFGWDTADKRLTIASTNTTGDVVNISDAALTSGTLFNFSATSTPTVGGTINMGVVALTDAASTLAPTTTGIKYSFANQGAIAHSQYALAISNASVGSFTDTTTEALLLLDQADTTGTGDTAVTDALRITNSGGSSLTNALTIGAGSQAIGTAINIASTGVTTDLVLQNGETIDNDANSTIRLTAATTSLTGDLSLAGTTGITLTGVGGDINFTNGESINNDTDNTLILASDAANGAGVVRLPVKTTTGDPSLDVAGNIYYNSADNKFRCYENAGWTDCIAASSGITGSGTAGQIAFFDTPSTITSETAGFGWDSTNKLLTLTSDALTTSVAQTISSASTSLSSGGLLALSKTGASGSTSFTGDIANIAYSQIFSGGVGLNSSGNVLDISRVVTLNNVGNTHTISGAVVQISDTGTQAQGLLVSTANVLSLAQNYTNTTGAVLGITNAGTGQGILLTSSSTGVLAQLDATGTGTTSEGLLIRQTSSGTITDAINVSDEAITNAINVGANTITGTSYLVTATTGDLSLAAAGKVNFSSSTKTIFTPSSTQTLSAASAITINSTHLKVAGSGGAVTLTSTPTIADGAEGDFVIVRGTNSTNTLTIQDQGTLPSSNLELGSTTRQLGNGDSIGLLFDGDVWTEMWFSGSIDADLAEMYKASADIDFGEVVALSETDGLRVDKATLSSGSKVIGISSAHPSLLIGDQFPNQVAIPVALAGRVPVKISSLSKPLAIGDPVAVSIEPGKIAKAARDGFIVGRALEAWTSESHKTEIMVFVNPIWYDPDLTLTDAGELIIEKDQGSKSADTQYQVKDSSGNVIDKTASFAKLIVGNVKAGAVSTQELAANNINALEGSVNNLLVLAGLKSPAIKTEEISPLGQSDLVINLDNTQPGSTTSFAKLSIKGVGGNEVASIDASGNTAFKGDATISGELRANKIYADEIVSKTASFANLSSANQNGVTREEIEKLLEGVKNDQTLLDQVTSWPINMSEETANLKEITSQNLYITDQAAVNSLSISHTLTLANDFVLQSSLIDAAVVNSIDTISAPLKIQSLALQPLEIMAGLFRIETNGDVVVNGNLLVKGEVESASLTLKQSSQEAGGSNNSNLLSLVNREGQKAAAISSSGSAEFVSVATNRLSIAQRIRNHITTSPATLSSKITQLPVRPPYRPD